MTFQAPTIAFFGATGGVANSVLVNAVRSGAKVVALVRTPSKLIQQLQAQGISETVLASQVTIISGNALDVTGVKSTLTANSSNYLVSHIVTGLGGSPSLRWNWSNPLQCATLDNPTICETAAHTLVTALEQIYAETPALAQRKPKLTFVSTTGVSDGPEDVPWGMQILYHQVLAVPHQDKREMERVFRNNMSASEGQTAVFGGVVGVRPTLLTGGVNADEGVGWEKIRAGREVAPITGWTVSRADVGQWIWINVVGNVEKRQQWEGENVTLAN